MNCDVRLTLAYLCGLCKLCKCFWPTLGTGWEINAKNVNIDAESLPFNLHRLRSLNTVRCLILTVLFDFALTRTNIWKSLINRC
jgi:hypothetical protein